MKIVLRLVLLITVSLFMLECSQENDNHSDLLDEFDNDSSDVNCEWNDSLEFFYSIYADLIIEPNENVESKTKELNDRWVSIISNRKDFLKFLFSDCSSESLYGTEFDEKLNISILPEVVHKLFWIEATYQKDYLFGKRISMGNSIVPYIQNPVSVFPKFSESEEDTTEYNYREYMNVRPDFSDEYLDLSLELFDSLKTSFETNGSINGTGAKWQGYEEKFFDSLFVNSTELPSDLLSF
ncbi:MAG: hypothetical protein MK105_02305 [Crocinitomicaceae bacterium]|nr:hypothetical protein [Crocinitomicaceae bacterium]